jgi:hypothetical protein
MRWHHAELINQQIKAPPIQRRLKEENHQIQPDQKVVYPGSAVPRLVVAKGKHRKSGNLIIG